MACERVVLTALKGIRFLLVPPLEQYSTGFVDELFYRSYSDSENLSGMLVAHTDAVWDLAVQTGSLQLLSASADGTCRLWSPTLKSPLLNSYIPEQGTVNHFQSFKY